MLVATSDQHLWMFVCTTPGYLYDSQTSITNYSIQGYFYPMLFSPSTLAKGFTLFSTCFDTILLYLKRDNLIHWNCPVLNSPTDNEDERGENKTWANISLYTVDVAWVCLLFPVHSKHCKGRMNEAPARDLGQHLFQMPIW